jgi:hypothetical protein
MKSERRERQPWPQARSQYHLFAMRSTCVNNTCVNISALPQRGLLLPSCGSNRPPVGRSEFISRTWRSSKNIA